MKPWWIVIGMAAACVLPPGYVGEPLPPPPMPMPARAAPMVERDPDARPIAAGYDDVFDRIAAADQQASAHRDEQAAEGYRDAAVAADQLLAAVRDRGSRYPTRHDGAITAAQLIANVRAARTQAAHLADDARERVIEALELELHVRSPAQRSVLRQHGRPDVARIHGQICWQYPEERFCWAANGRLAKRTVTAHREPPPRIASRPRRDDSSDSRDDDSRDDDSRDAGDSREASDASPSSAPARPAKASIAYYAAATFASGSCSFGDCLKSGWSTETPGGTVRTSCSFGDCAKSGWTSEHPDGSQSSTSCSFGDCFKDGWTTSHPDGTQSTTSCSFGDCMKSGWSTSMPDGTESSTSCNFGDCAKDGWTTTLPSGHSVSCSCNFSDCLTNGASCN